MTASALIKESDLHRMAKEFAAGKIGLIYFVTNPEAETVKIGYSANFHRRLEVIQTGNHVQLLAYSGFRSVPFTERLIHRLFKDQRILNEWFRHTDDLDNLIQCFEEYTDEHDGEALGPDAVSLVFDDWSNSFGKGRSAAAACGNNVDDRA